MSIFSKWKKKHNNVATSVEPVPKECIAYREIKDFIDSLLCQDHYIARSEYNTVLKKYIDTIDFFRVLQKSGTLEVYCKTNNLSESEVAQTLSRFDAFDSIIDSQNERFVQLKLRDEQDYLDKILVDCDPAILLDEDQRRVVLTDEDFCLVIAGAGAGKTTTVAAKVKYLVEKQHIDPKQILVISFTNKAVNELKQHITGELHIECPIATFHSTGNAILRKQHPERINIVDDSKLYYVIQDYLKGSILKNESSVNNLIMFFASYFDAPYEGHDINHFFNSIAKSSFTSLRSEISDYQEQVIDTRTKKSVTIQSEVLRSNQEVEIANFLFLNNIDYEYEPLYPYDILLARKPYTPDFIIRQGEKTAYIEHFGVNENGTSTRFTPYDLAAYRKSIQDKIKLHREHGTNLIFTFSSYNDRKPLTEHLKEKLENAGFVLTPRPNREVLEMLVSSEENRYIRKLVALICRFISNFKTNGYTADEFIRMYHSTQNVRTRLFLDICNDCYLEYQRVLKENDAVDFQDMINESARILREVKEMKQKLDFKYIIVDEYQDISRQRFDLVTALHEVCDAKIIAVGDDWQSIYAFSGSDITLFTKFAEKMGYAKMMKIVRTYRNSQEIIDIAGAFIQKNREQIQKELISSKRITDPVIIYTYDSTRKTRDGDNRSGISYAIAHTIETVLAQIIAFNKAEGKPQNSSILLLGRFGFDGDRLERSGLFEFINRGSKLKSVKYPKLNITFMTAHSSKGLGYDNVVVINGRNETYGFPSKIEDDPVLSFVIKGDRAIDFAEERRLFYVALTRTKNRVFFIAPEQNPSEFLLELKHDYKNVVLRGNWNDDPKEVPFYKKTCPLCGYPLQFRYKNSYGLRLYLCTNEPEVCGFMTNEYKAGKLSIIKCDQCRDGFLIVKPSQKDDYFLGCTNYKADGTGCKRTMTKSYFYQLMNITDTDPCPSVKKPKGIEIKDIQNIDRPPAVQSVDNHTPLSEPPYPEPEDSFAGLPRFIKKAVLSTNDPAVIQANDVLHTVLQCLSDISTNYFYGAGILSAVLRGVASKRIKERGLDKVNTFGNLSEMSPELIDAIINWAILHKYILRTKSLYPVLHPTYEGTHYEETISARKLQNFPSI
ncbi:MAG: UvrD-helicase domain-containing protein [Clostridia bacterium]|nr:UvrD-helicase domain-containing protein [Clostridia bacterium]